MDFASIVRRRLEELGIEQRELALAACVTESYISQLLAKKKTPPALERTDLYDGISKVLGLPSKDLAKLAEAQRREALKRKIIDPPSPLHPELRRFLLHKCAAPKKKPTAHIFEREPFGEFERLVAQNVLDVARRVIKREMIERQWLGRLSRLVKKTPRNTEASIFALLNADLTYVSIDKQLECLEPLIVFWDIDFANFSIVVSLNKGLSRAPLKRLSFREDDAKPDRSIGVQPGLAQFLNDEKLSAGLTAKERSFLESLSFEGRQPSPLYYYRELQNLRDPLNFFPVTIVRRGP